MSYNIEISGRFEKEIRKLIRKSLSLKNEYAALVASLKENPNQGTPIGHHCFKIRIAIESKGTGKSGGARIITNVYVAGNVVYLLTIYDKSEQDNITDKDLLKLIKVIR